jgi:cardiolipin synthase
LLEAGIMVFEWNGPMLHAKTAVADAHWERVGSTNLNIASWIGNWEMDVAVEDERFGQVRQGVSLEGLRPGGCTAWGGRHRFHREGAWTRERRAGGGRCDRNRRHDRRRHDEGHVMTTALGTLDGHIHD